jgi:hypothetical protein
VQGRQATRGSSPTATSAGERPAPGPSSQKPPSATRHESDQVPESARAIVLIVINQRHAAVPPRGRYRTQGPIREGSVENFSRERKTHAPSLAGADTDYKQARRRTANRTPRPKPPKQARTERQVTHALAKLQSPPNRQAPPRTHQPRAPTTRYFLQLPPHSAYSASRPCQAHRNSNTHKPEPRTRRVHSKGASAYADSTPSKRGQV